MRVRGRVRVKVSNRVRQMDTFSSVFIEEIRDARIVSINSRVKD